jgi:hypothetical protein
MIAYANYYNDARIKNYVDTLIKNGFEVDIFALGTHKLNEQKNVRVFTVMQKYCHSYGFSA